MSSAPNPHVLVVDDDKVMGELLVALLTLKGYNVMHVHSGAEALDTVRHRGPEIGIVLCDVHMPGLGGRELASALTAARDGHSLPADTLLIGMSGSTPDVNEARLFDAFLHKPFSMEDFAAAVERTRKQRSQTAKVRNASSAARQADPAAATEDRTAAQPLDERTFSQLRAQLEDEQLRQLYDMTLDDVHARLERMSESARHRDEKTVRREAHAIKGSCGMVGARELQELAAATEGGSALDTSALADFRAACQRLQRMLDERFRAA